MTNEINNSIHDLIEQHKLSIGFAVVPREQSTQIRDLYDTYKGEKELLYIPPVQEIEETIVSGKGSYLGAYHGSRLIGVCKIAQLDVPSPFFIPPAYENPTGDYYGLSGIYVHIDYRKRGLARQMSDISNQALHDIGATGVYADCDYRNTGSFTLLSSMYNFAGFTDGTNGAENEQTVYVTFYKNLQSEELHRPVPSADLRVVDMKSPKTVAKHFAEDMAAIAPYSVHRVPYGGGDRHNILHVFDKPVVVEQINLHVPEKSAEPTVFRKKHHAGLGCVLRSFLSRENS